MERAGAGGTHRRDIPDAHACLRILECHGVPAHIVRHSRKVAALALRLRRDLARCSQAALDETLVLAAALLHDIAKARCAGTALDHAAEGGKILRALGLDGPAFVVERHVDPGPSSPGAPLTEAELVAYCDKRILHDRVVPLSERFRYLEDRYGATGVEVLRRIAKTRSRMAALEERIFSSLPYSPGEVPLGEGEG